jgi:hypothetical protein
MYTGLHVKQPVFLSDFNETCIFSTGFQKMLKNKISWKSVQWEPSCPMQMNGQTDMMKIMVIFHNFANTPKNVTECFMIYSLSSLLHI